MKTFKFSLVLRTRENTDVFISLDDNIYGIHSKRINILYLFRWPNVSLLVGPSLGQRVGITLGQRMSMLITTLGQRWDSVSSAQFYRWANVEIMYDANRFLPVKRGCYV